ncbi:50S ribosomal protein L6, partial [Gammaproteobacteria bacterium]|nr:50S ribosomal protein L6 [Gammaproteobacteria bacterium]
MSRVAKNPIPVPAGVEITFDGNLVKVAGSKDKMEFLIPASVSANHSDDLITVSWDETSSESTALAGTTRSLINNMIIGVTEGYTKTLILVGVGYRAKANGKKLELTL